MVRFLLFVLSASFAYIIFKLNFIAKYAKFAYNVLQQGLPMNGVPDWIETKGTMNIVSLRPRYPTMHFSAFKISDGCLIVQDWTKYVMGERREVLGGSKQIRYPRLGDRFICILQLDQGGELYMFYVILPKRAAGVIC